MGKSLLCHVVIQIQLQRLVANLLWTCCGLVGRVANTSATSWQLPHLWESYGETCVMNFGHKPATHQ